MKLRLCAAAAVFATVAQGTGTCASAFPLRSFAFDDGGRSLSLIAPKGARTGARAGNNVRSVCEIAVANGSAICAPSAIASSGPLEDRDVFQLALSTSFSIASSMSRNSLSPCTGPSFLTDRTKGRCSDIFASMGPADEASYAMEQLTVMPVPGAMPLLVSGIVGLGFAISRRKPAAQ